jgi:hypothetical protein
MAISKLVVALFLLVLSVQFICGLSATVGEAKVVLKPEVPIGGLTIDRSLTVVNQNEFDVNVKIIEGDDPENIIEVVDTEVFVKANEEAPARYKIHLLYGGDYSRKLIASFKPADPALGSSSLGMVSNIVIIATGMPAPPGYGAQPVVNSTPVVVPVNTTVEPNATQPANTTQPGTSWTSTTVPGTTQPGNKPNVWVGIIVVAAVVLLGAGIFALIWKLGLLK